MHWQYLWYNECVSLGGLIREVSRSETELHSVLRTDAKGCTGEIPEGPDVTGQAVRSRTLQRTRSTYASPGAILLAVCSGSTK